MTATVGTSTNTNTEAFVGSEIALNASTTTKLLDAQLSSDPPRIKVILQNAGATSLWVKFQPATDDDDKKGILVGMTERVTLLEGSDIYTGEISAIANTGTPSVFVTWF